MTSGGLEGSSKALQSMSAAWDGLERELFKGDT
jgi:hypothetical protein